MVRFLALMSLTLAATAAAQDHAHHRDGAMARARPELGATAAYDAQGVLMAVRKRGRHVVLQRSADDGKTWDAGVEVNREPEDVGADGDARPRVAFGARGEVYVTWTQPLSKPYTGNIRFARSNDGARTFSAPVTVHTDRQEITHRFDSLAVNRSGQVFVAWIDKRDQVARGKGYRGAALYYAVSDDAGASFRGDFRASEHSCECCRIALLPEPDGSMLALWRHVFEPNVRDHALQRLNADGTTGPMRRATFDDWRIDACPHQGPSLVKDSAGALHGVWYSGTPGKEGVYYGRLLDGRVDAQRRIGGDGAAYADIAAAGRRLAIVWKEFDGKSTTLKAMRSDDNGKSWHESQLAATTGASDQPKVMRRGDGFTAFWNTVETPLSTVVLP